MAVLSTIERVSCRRDILWSPYYQGRLLVTHQIELTLLRGGLTNFFEKIFLFFYFLFYAYGVSVCLRYVCALYVLHFLEPEAQRAVSWVLGI